MKKNIIFIALIMCFLCFCGCTSTSTFTGNETGDETSFLTDFDILNSTLEHTLLLDQKDELAFDIVHNSGKIDICLINQETKQTVYQGNDADTGSFIVSASDTGNYLLTVTGDKARGSVSVQLVNEVQSYDNTIEWNQNSIYAAAFLGYGDDVTKDKIQDISDRYLNGRKEEQLRQFDFGGDENYLIIPKEEVYYTVISEYGLDNGIEKAGKMLDVIHGNEPFILTCNPSDLIPNCILHFKTEDGSVTFLPSISLKDGSVCITEEGQIIE